MKEATTDPCVKKMSVPIKTIVIVNNANYYFFILNCLYQKLQKQKNVKIDEIGQF